MIHEYEQSNQRMQRQIEEKQERIKRLQEDSGNTPELEYEIRNRLKLAKPGEKIYILDDKKQ